MRQEHVDDEQKQWVELRIVLITEKRGLEKRGPGGCSADDGWAKESTSEWMRWGGASRVRVVAFAERWGLDLVWRWRFSNPHPWTGSGL